MSKQIRTLEERLRIIEEVDKNPLEKKVSIAKRLGIPPSTLNSIICKKSEIREQAYKCGNSAKRRKTSKESTYSQLESVLFAWYQQARASNIPVNGNILREKALKVAASNGIDNFCASNGWISRFKERHGLVFKKLCGESAAVDTDSTHIWLQKLPELLVGYEDRDIYNADETGLFFNCLPERTLALKGETCHGGKSAKQRLTVLLCVNVDGSDKRIPIVIGKSAKPRCFKNTKKLPVIYHSNKKAWMTNEIFSSFLRDLDVKVGLQKRKIILFIDNCSAHSPDISSLQNVKVLFYPPNCTSVLQPLDMGIIKCFKQSYRKKLVQRALGLMDEGNSVNLKIDVLQAIHFIVASWQQVTQPTIRNCFVKCGYNRKCETSHILTEIGENADDVPSELWVRLCPSTSGVKFNEYVSVDDELMTCGLRSIDEIGAELQNTNEEDDMQDDADEDEENDTKPLPSFTEALTAFNTMRSFLYAHDISERDQKNIVNIENLLFTIQNNRSVQPKITNFFK